MTDRRASPSPWADPRLWISVMALLLTVALYLLTSIYTKLQSIDVAVQGMVKTNAEQGVKVENLKDDMRDVKGRMSKVESDLKDYNFNIAGRLGALEGGQPVARKGK